jgi:hypothetical protein
MRTITNSPPHIQRKAPVAAQRLVAINKGFPFQVAADRLTFSGKAKKPNVLHQIWQWLKDIPKRLSAYLKRLFDIQPRTIKPQPIIKPEVVPFCHIDPKLANDPFERQRIATLIAEQTFDDVVKLYQQSKASNTNPKDIHRDIQEPAAALLTEKAQKLLHTNAVVTRVDFLPASEPSSGIRGTFSPPHSIDHDPTKPRKSLGAIHINPGLRNLDLNNPEHRQLVYKTYIHEIQHLVYSYAKEHTVESGPPTKPASGDPEYADYRQYLGCVVTNGAGGALDHLLTDTHPDLPDLTVCNQTLFEDVKPEALQGYQQSLKQLWERTDSPVLSSREKEEFDQFLAHSDPKLTKEWMDSHSINELESYMTAFKRAPGLDPHRLYPSDFGNFSQAMYLRDYLRHYYQHPRHQVPLSEQHPFAQVRPFELAFTKKD